MIKDCFKKGEELLMHIHYVYHDDLECKFFVLSLSLRIDKYLVNERNTDAHFTSSKSFGLPDFFFTY